MSSEASQYIDIFHGIGENINKLISILDANAIMSIDTAKNIIFLSLQNMHPVLQDNIL